MRFEEPKQEINFGLLEAGWTVFLPEGECEVLKVDTFGALVQPIAKRERSFTAYKSKNPAVKSKDEIQVIVRASSRAFYISARSEVRCIKG